MIAADQGVRIGTVALLALAAASCNGAAAPTAWIPRNGTITGVISTTGGSLAPPAMDRSTARAQALTFRAPPGIRVFPQRRLVSSLARQAHPASRAASTPNDLVVTFRSTALGAPPLGSAALSQADRVLALGGTIRLHLTASIPSGAAVAGVSPTILTALIRLADTTQRDAITVGLLRDPAVAAVTRNRLVWLEESARAFVGIAAAAPGQRTPNDPLYPFQAWHYGLIDLPRAWTITEGSPGVLVAVVDDGIRFDHPAIAANLTSDGYDFVNNLDSLTLCAGGKISNADDGNGYDPDPTIPASYHPDSTGTCYIPDTLGGHGLHVAGTIGAVGNDGIGTTGVNWIVRIRPVRALGVGGFGTAYDIAQGVLYAAGLPADNGAGGTVKAPSGAKIINLSLGSPVDDSTLHAAIISAQRAGALIVAAAGNTPGFAPFYPASDSAVLAVSAVGPDGAPAPYSNGRPVGIEAPGGNFALGDASDGVASTIWNFATATPEYALAEGTSMAAPHVSGVAALLAARDPFLSPSDLVFALIGHVVGSASSYGYGLVDAYNSLTGSSGPPTQVYARLYALETGAALQTVSTAAGAFAFSHVPAGSYLIYGGTDESGDQQIGVPGRLWGALGGSAFPTPVTLLGAGSYDAGPFAIGFPTPSGTEGVLAIGGYMQGQIIDSTTLDIYRVKIPDPGLYTFETSGWVGACGLALEEATALGLYDSVGTFITSVAYIDPTRYNFCSRLTRPLNPGTYFVGVRGLFPGRRYRLQARAGT